MTTVLIHSRHRRAAWWQFIGNRLSFADRVVLSSEFRGDGDLHIMPEFYRQIRNVDACASRAVETFGFEACDDIVRRCRLLRSVDPTFALAMVGAMWKALTDAIEATKPTVGLSFCIDNYVMDLFDRILAANDIPYIGISRSVLDGRTLVSTRGEHNNLRRPSSEEILDAVNTIARPSFAPFLPVNGRYDSVGFLQRYIYFTARAAAFNWLGRWRHDPLNFHYWLRKPELGFRVRLRDYKTLAYVTPDWEARLTSTPADRRVLVALSRNPEASTDYWVKDLRLIDYPAVLERILNGLIAAGFVPMVKDHPNMFGFREVELYERLSKIPEITFLPCQVSSQYLLSQCEYIFTYGGTIGLQAAFAGRKAIVVDPYYFIEDYFIRIKTLEDVNRLPGMMASFIAPPMTDLTRLNLAAHVLTSCLPGDMDSCRNFSLTDSSSVQRTTRLAESMNQYIPEFLDRS